MQGLHVPSPLAIALFWSLFLSLQQKKANTDKQLRTYVTIFVLADRA